jgi:hypothetical protein
MGSPDERDLDYPEWLSAYTNERKHDREIGIIKVALIIGLPVLVAIVVLQRIGVLR